MELHHFEFCYLNSPGMSGRGTALGFENLFFNTLFLTNFACLLE